MGFSIVPVFFLLYNYNNFSRR